MLGIKLIIGKQIISVFNQNNRYNSLILYSGLNACLKFSGCNFDTNRTEVWCNQVLNLNDYIQVIITDLTEESAPISTTECFPISSIPIENKEQELEFKLKKYKKLETRLMKKGLIANKPLHHEKYFEEEINNGFLLKISDQCITAALPDGVVSITFDMNNKSANIRFSGLDCSRGDNFIWFDAALKYGDIFDIKLTNIRQNSQAIKVVHDENYFNEQLNQFIKLQLFLKEEGSL